MESKLEGLRKGEDMKQESWENLLLFDASQFDDMLVDGHFSKSECWDELKAEGETKG